MKKILLLLIPAVLFGCKSPEEKTIATVAKQTITQGDFNYEVERLSKVMIPAGYELTEEEKITFDTQVLESMIMKLIYTAKLDELEITADEALVEEQYSKLIEQYGSEAALIEDLESKGFSSSELREEFTYQFRLSALSEVAAESDLIISDEEISTYYNENKESVFAMQGGVQAARHILLTTEERTPEEALVKIKEIKEEIANGMEFSEAAIKYSEGPSGPNGGNLGQFQKGQMVKEFDDVAFSIDLKTVSEPVLTQYGYHLIIVDDRSETVYATLEETTDYISNKLKVEKYFEEIEDSTKIKRPKWAQQEV